VYVFNYNDYHTDGMYRVLFKLWPLKLKRVNRITNSYQCNMF